MVAKQIYAIAISLGEQFMGKKNLEPTEANFIAVGEKIKVDDKAREQWFNALTDRINKTVIDIKKYRGRNPDMMYDPIDFGAAIQKIYIEMPKPVQNDTWTDHETNADPDAFAGDFKVEETIFKSLSTWSVNGTMPDTQIFMAFTNATTMAAFMAGLMTAMENSMEVALENVSDFTRAAFMARKIKSGNMIVDVLAAYNKDTGRNIPWAVASKDKDFLLYLGTQRKLWADRMGRMSVLFNTAGRERFTSPDDMVFTVLSEVGASIDFFMKAVVHDKNEADFGKYNTVPSWQATGAGADAFSFEQTSSINVKLDEGDTVTKSGIIGMLYDRNAFGITIDKRRVRARYNESKEWTSYFMKADMGYFNDMTQNAVIFVVSDPVGAVSISTTDADPVADAE